MIWKLCHPAATPDSLGFIPSFLDEDDPASAREQIDRNYAHGGGFVPLAKIKMDEHYLRYPGDPPFPLIAETKLRDETIRLYRYSWLAIIQADGSYEVAKID